MEKHTNHASRITTLLALDYFAVPSCAALPVVLNCDDLALQNCKHSSNNPSVIFETTKALPFNKQVASPRNNKSSRHREGHQMLASSF